MRLPQTSSALGSLNHCMCSPCKVIWLLLHCTTALLQGSLVNTLTLYKGGDLRLDAFARFLSEEWDFATFLAFLTATSLLLGVSRMGTGAAWETRWGLLGNVGVGGCVCWAWLLRLHGGLG